MHPYRGCKNGRYAKQPAHEDDGVVLLNDPTKEDEVAGGCQLREQTQAVTQRVATQPTLKLRAQYQNQCTRSSQGKADYFSGADGGM